MDGMQQAQSWLATHGTAFVVNLVVFLLVLLAGRIAIGSAVRVAGQMMARSERVSEMLANFLASALSKALWVIVLMIALGQLGIDIGPLIAGLGVAGFVIGFAFQESLGNLAAGVMIMLNRPFDVGDYVDAGGESGTVTDLNFMATTLTTPDNKEIVVPNRAVWSSSVTNYTANETRRVEWTVGIGYSSDIGRAIEIAHEILQNDDQVLAEPEPLIAVKELADSSVNLVIRAWTATDDFWTVFFRVNRIIKERYDEAEIEIPFPQRDIHHHGSVLTRS